MKPANDIEVVVEYSSEQSTVVVSWKCLYVWGPFLMPSIRSSQGRIIPSNRSSVAAVGKLRRGARCCPYIVPDGTVAVAVVPVVAAESPPFLATGMVEFSSSSDEP